MQSSSKSKNNKTLLFCFTYAGGNVDFYDQLEAACPEVEFIKLEYSGHGKRNRERLYSSFNQLTDDLYPCIRAVMNDSSEKEYGLMGYSMGSIAAFDMLKRISSSNLQRPSCIFISSHEPVPMKIPEHETDEWIKRRTLEFGGIDQRLVNNEVFWRMYLPIYRSDYEIISKYKFDNNFHTDIPVSLLYSETDINTSDMLLWKKYFKGEVDVHNFTGGHFFLNKHVEEVAQIVRNGLK